MLPTANQNMSFYQRSKAWYSNQIVVVRQDS